MTNIPFGLGGSSEQDQPSGGGFHQMAQRIRAGIRNGPGIHDAGIGALAAFLGMPYMTMGYGGVGAMGGDWRRMLPGTRGRFGGHGGGNGGGGTTPPIEDPPLPPADGNGNGTGTGGGGVNPVLLSLLYPPPIGTGAQWRNTMKYGA